MTTPRFPRIDAGPTHPRDLAVGERVVIVYAEERFRINLYATFAGRPIRTITEARQLGDERFAIKTTGPRGSERWLVNDRDRERPLFIRVDP